MDYVKMGADGHKWAHELCARFPEYDEKLMVTWFCNAIWAGEVAGMRASEQYAPLPPFPQIKKSFLDSGVRDNVVETLKEIK